MLKSLLIRNYALIEKLEMAPGKGLTIITGETGAGKSIVLGALGLVMGNRADTKVLMSTEEKCLVEAVFVLPDLALKPWFDGAGLEFEQECILRREIAPSGKSRAFINDTPTDLETLRALADQLIDIHSQHDTLQLANQTYQLSLLDAYAGLLLETERVSVGYQGYKAAQKALEEARNVLKTAGLQQDFIAFQAGELKKAAIRPDEVEALEEEQNLLAHAEEIQQKMALADGLLQSSEGDAVSKVKGALQGLERALAFAPALLPIVDRLRSSYVELRDIAAEVEAVGIQMEFDPNRLETVQARLNQLQLLLRKHNVQTTAELLAVQAQLAESQGSFVHLEERVVQLEAESDAKLQEATVLAAGLSKKRKAAAPAMAEEITALLAEVGMPNATLVIELSPAALGSSGQDQVRILFSANKGVAPQDLKTAASGGEFSRLMLCLKYVLAGKTNLPTLIFDEIDTGISGEIALRVARLMGRMAERHQLLVITHMPQIAARPGQHYWVYKEETANRTYTHVKPLSDAERLQEIAQMIGGKNPSAAAINSAKELMGQ